MQTDNKILDDLAKVATSALGTLQGVRGEVEARLREQFERVLANMDMVTREEFDAVKAMAVAARVENEALGDQIKDLEIKVAKQSRKPAMKKSGAKNNPA